jgi:Fic family protein
MFRKIKDKMQQLDSRKPFDREVMEEIELLNAVDWAYSCLNLKGSPITKETVSKVVHGQFVVEATIEEHSLIQRHENTLKEALRLLEMDNDLTEKVFIRLCSKFIPEGQLEYRRGNPVILTFGFNPVFSRDIKEELLELFKWLYSEDASPEINRNEILKAAYLHGRFIEIYPFEEYTEELACIVLYYYLMQKGYPPFTIRFSRQEYHNAVSAYLKKNDIAPLYNCLERSIFNKIEVLLQLTSPL